LRETGRLAVAVFFADRLGFEPVVGRASTVRDGCQRGAADAVLTASALNAAAKTANRLTAPIRIGDFRIMPEWKGNIETWIRP